MTIHHINGEPVELTAEEQAAFEASVAEWEAGADERAAQRVRSERDHKLTTEVDPIVTNPLRWDDLSTEKQDEWKAYRKALLDVTAQEGFPNEVVWPTKPE